MKKNWLRMGLLSALGVWAMTGCGDTIAEEGESDSNGNEASDDDSEGDTDTDTDTDSETEEEPDSEDAFGCAITGGGTQSGYYTFDLDLCDDNYKVQTNPWGGAVQTITAGGNDVFRVDSMEEPAGGEAWDIAAFPSVYRGTAQGGNPSEDSGMPIAVSDIETIPTGFATNSSSIEFGGNVTFDVYFTEAETYSRGAPDVYLMVWFDANALNPINTEGEGWSCRGDPPTYIDSCSGAGSVQIDDKTFYRFFGSNGHAPVISYAPETRFDAWEFDLNDFIQDAAAEGYLTDSMYLQSIQAGFELVTGGEGITVEGFYTRINE